MLRLGIKSDEIVFEDGGIFGDEVTIAAWLEGVVPAGGVLISQAVWQGVQQHVGEPFQDNGIKRPRESELRVRALVRRSVAARQRQDVAADLFVRGVCLPSGLKMSDEQQNRIVDAIANGLRMRAPAGWH